VASCVHRSRYTSLPFALCHSTIYTGLNVFRTRLGIPLRCQRVAQWRFLFRHVTSYID
jgi:hypothetical protein